MNQSCPSAGAADALACPLCGSRDHRLIYRRCTISNVFAIPGAILRCEHCRMWFKQVETGQTYEEAYGQEYADQSKNSHYMESDITRRFFRKVLDRVRRETPAATPRLLDVGAGMGAMLKTAIELGYDAEGVDLSPGLVEAARAKGFRVRQGDVAQLSEIDAFDVVTMMDLVEHVPEPIAVLQAIHRSLKPGGELVVFTPNHRGAAVLVARAMKLLGIDYAVNEIFGCNHVCFFDDHTLPMALAKAGFKVRRLWKFPYDPRRPGCAMSVLNLTGITAIEWMGWPFGRVSRMVAYARK